MTIKKAKFLLSQSKFGSFPQQGMPEIAMAGKSNVGKSSVINRLLNRKNFAKVGSAPGKTSHINYFKIDDKLYLVDLPGYGYARVSRQEKERWAKLIQSWFDDRTLMTLGILIVDARHKPTADDKVMADYFKSTGRPYAVVANKLDKLKKSEIDSNLTLIRETLELDNGVKVIPFSAEKGTGREELVRLIVDHLETSAIQELQGTESRGSES